MSKKMQNKKPHTILLISTLQKVRVGKKTTLIYALPTHCKLLTETVSVSDIVIGEGTFGHVKVDHLSSLDLSCAFKEGKEKFTAIL